MSRRTVYLLTGGLVVLLAAGVLLAAHLWTRQQRAAVARAGVADLPDLRRWPAELNTRLEHESEAVWRSADPVEPLTRLAGLYCANGFSREAEQALGALVRLEPRNARWPYLQADMRVRVNNQTGAEAALRTALALAPDYAPGWLRLGEMLANRGARAEAGRCFTQALAAAPTNVWAAYDRLLFQSQEPGGVPVALPGVENLVRTHPGIKELHMLLADVQSAARHPEEAARQRRLAAESELNLNTEDPWVDTLAGVCFDSNRMLVRAMELRREARLAEAEELFRRIAALAPLEPANPIAWGMLANFYVKTGRPEVARAEVEKAVAEFPDEPQMPLLLAQLLCETGQPAAGVAVARRAVARWTDRADLRAALGVALRDTGDFSGGAEALREALRIDATLTEAHYHLGTCLTELGDFDAARSAFARAVAMRPDYREALFALGAICLKSGDAAGAAAPVSRLYALNPEDAGVRQMFAAWNLLTGMAEVQAGDLPAAESHYQAGLAAAPDFPALLREAGTLAVQRGRPAEARACFERYLAAEPADPRGYLLFGKLLRRLGQGDEARTVYQRGVTACRSEGDESGAREIEAQLGR